MSTDNIAGLVVLTVLEVVSFAFAIIIYLQFSQQQSPLRRFQNRLLVYLLLQATWTIVFDLSNTIKYFWTNTVTIYMPWFCVIWNISFLSSAAFNRILAAFMCVERHFLIFSPQNYHSHRQRIIYHYIPVICLSSFLLIYMIITNVFITCSNLNFNYSNFMCGYTCAILIGSLGSIYTWISIFIPTLIIVVACILLPIRFLIQKRTLQQLNWHRARKLLVQTSIIASIYIMFWLPYTIILQLIFSNILTFSTPHINQALAILPFMTSLLTPFIIYHTIRKPFNVNLIEQLRQMISFRQQVAVRPAPNSVAPT